MSATATTCAIRFSRIGARVRRAHPRRHARRLRAGSRPSSPKQNAWRAKRTAKSKFLRSPEEAVAGAQAVYTDVWASMGQEEEAAAARSRLRRLSGERSSFRACRAGRRFPALPAGASRPGSHRRGHRLAALDRLRSGGKSPARPKSDPAHYCSPKENDIAEESCSCLFRRSRYLHHYSVAEGEL